jgi:hypothetical protein
METALGEMVLYAVGHTADKALRCLSGRKNLLSLQSVPGRLSRFSKFLMDHYSCEASAPGVGLAPGERRDFIALEMLVPITDNLECGRG